MGRFSNGVKYYTKATLDVYFPEDMVCCAECPLLKIKQTGHPACAWNNVLIYATDTRGDHCPLKFENEGEKSNDNL